MRSENKPSCLFLAMRARPIPSKKNPHVTLKPGNCLMICQRDRSSMKNGPPMAGSFLWLTKKSTAPFGARHGRIDAVRALLAALPSQKYVAVCLPSATYSMACVRSQDAMALFFWGPMPSRYRDHCRPRPLLHGRGAKTSGKSPIGRQPSIQPSAGLAARGRPPRPSRLAWPAYQARPAHAGRRVGRNGPLFEKAGTFLCKKSASIGTWTPVATPCLWATHCTVPPQREDDCKRAPSWVL